MRLLFFLFLFLPIDTFANALLPLNNIWNSEHSHHFYIAYILILLIEVSLLKAFYKQISFSYHLKAILLANFLSSLVGSLVVNFWVSTTLYLDSNYLKIFSVFFIVTILIEFPILKFFYKRFYLRNLFFKIFFANFLTYILLFVLQLVGVLVTFEWIRIKADRASKAWQHKEIVPPGMKIIYSKNINRGMDTEVSIFSSDNVNVLKNFSGKNIRGIEGDFILIGEERTNCVGEIYNWRANRKVQSENNICQTEMFYSKEMGLIIFRKRTGLEGEIDSKGWRKMYGYSYEVEADPVYLNETLQNVRSGGIFRIGKDLIYSAHDECVRDQKENKVERCLKDPSTHIVRTNHDGSITYLSKNSEQPVLRGQELYFLNRKKQIEKINILNNEKSLELEDSITAFRVSKDEKYFVVTTENMFPLGRRYLLVLIERHSGKRFIIDDGQINDFDIVEP